MSQPLVNKEELLREVDIFEEEIELRKQGKMEEKVFAETRLRRGVYGQRYDNGQRHDGTISQKIPYPSGELMKGPNTLWDAPGMLRIKVPFGGLIPEQLEVIAELAEEYSDDIAHVTTRQDFQLHYIHIDDTPTIMRRLAHVGITTREACGNSVRNVTACPIAGVCHDETFDVTPYASAITKFLLGHPDAQNFGRKFKIAFSGCSDHACGLVSMHDFGAIAVKRIIDNKEKRGFELYVGGGLGAVPYPAKLFDDFLPEEELLPTAQAMARVFARLGEKKNRARARIKFLIQKLGIEEFRRLVLEERTQLPEDPRWTEYLKDIDANSETPLKSAGNMNGHHPEGFNQWLKDNIYLQKQKGYATATIRLPLGDLTAHQLRKLADIARQFINGTVRATVEQNIVLRWVSEADLPNLYLALKDVHLAEAGAGTIEDITTCPGTDTCKLGISSSRGLTGELRQRFANGFLRSNGETVSKDAGINDVIRNLRIKVSGCFNSCGQHHISDLGFYGINRKVGSYSVPHFQVILGGQWTENAGSYGLAVGAVPSQRIPDVIERIASRYKDERLSDETFQDFTRRIGKVQIKKILEDLMKVPSYEENSDFYSDWGDPREYTIGDMGIGECAGEVISAVDFALSSAEREIFEAQIALEKKDIQEAAQLAYRAMLRGARALVNNALPEIPDEANRIIEEFRNRLFDTKIFFDPYAGGKFGRFLFMAHKEATNTFTEEKAHQRIEEAQLFIDAAHQCYIKLSSN